MVCRCLLNPFQSHFISTVHQRNPTIHLSVKQYMLTVDAMIVMGEPAMKPIMPGLETSLVHLKTVLIVF